MKKKKKAASIRDKIVARLGCFVFVKPMRSWLDTGNRWLNAVLGSGDLGMPAGKVYHFAGKKHGGKTALCAWLAGLLQRLLGVFVIWVDLENSYDRAWMKRLGVNTNSTDFYLVYPKILAHHKQRKRGKKTTKAGEQFLQSAEYLFAEAEEVIKCMKAQDKKRKFVVIIDSIANLQTEMVVDKGATDQNMRSNMDRAQFLGNVLPRWIHLAKNYTMWVFLINQVRTNPAVLFGDNEYSPGGKALDHNAHVMIKIRRKGEGLDKHAFAGYFKNVKNKAGGGSEESQMCSYRVDLTKKGDKIFSFGKIKEKKAKIE